MAKRRKRRSTRRKKDSGKFGAMLFGVAIFLLCGMTLARLRVWVCPDAKATAGRF